jgi:hypothetical protein
MSGEHGNGTLAYTKRCGQIRGNYRVRAQGTVTLHMHMQWRCTYGSQMVGTHTTVTLNEQKQCGQTGGK